MSVKLASDVTNSLCDRQHVLKIEDAAGFILFFIDWPVEYREILKVCNIIRTK